MKWPVCLGLLIVLRSTGGTPLRNEQFAFHILRGDEYYRAFDNQRALKEYAEAYRLAPDSFSALQRMVVIYNDLGRIYLHHDTSSISFYQKSLEFSDTLCARFPERAESHFWLALNEGSLIPFSGVKEKVMRAKKVLAETHRALQLDSTLSAAYVLLGIFQREAANIGWFERVIARVVFGAEVSGTVQEAESLFHKALQYDTTNPYAYFELFWTYRAMGKDVKARESLLTLVSLTPTNEREREQREEARVLLAELDEKR
ncbi:MAG TPA: tetratricopeptide repeat protein [Bacteroidota bacterium]|nr:tetratricopeptide repeat protein [Bacteroidota bacterium]